MHLMRALFFFTTNSNITLSCSHTPGVDNGAADALSRDDVASFVQQVPGARVSQAQYTRADPGTDSPKARLDLKKLDQLAAGYFSRGLADSTQRTYLSAQGRFLVFCRVMKWEAVPASELTVLWATLQSSSWPSHSRTFLHLSGCIPAYAVWM